MVTEILYVNTIWVDICFSMLRCHNRKQPSIKYSKKTRHPDGTWRLKLNLVVFFIAIAIKLVILRKAIRPVRESTAGNSLQHIQTELQINQRNFNIELNRLLRLNQFNQLRARWLGNLINLGALIELNWLMYICQTLQSRKRTLFHCKRLQSLTIYTRQVAKG